MPETVRLSCTASVHAYSTTPTLMSKTVGEELAYVQSLLLPLKQRVVPCKATTRCCSATFCPAKLQISLELAGHASLLLVAAPADTDQGVHYAT